ncbi:hypothetical protein GALMADRAFT_147706 [Galerina marginata CBS 339.88]|uniref:Uncharacterized protein n=1 Tax=Galerina marginata (strain CBS 339.88) TaxID=685588 RepID=A0A067S774_GALM3|nr:hypothetical protein GALMADRAFT_147706 [Galerina marginata CBS 339.88]
MWGNEGKSPAPGHSALPPPLWRHVTTTTANIVQRLGSPPRPALTPVHDNHAQRQPASLGPTFAATSQQEHTTRG